jgi:hypothetical protein
VTFAIRDSCTDMGSVLSGVVSTVAGSAPSVAYTFGDGIGTNSILNGPYLISISSSSIVYVADYYNYRIRAFDSTGRMLYAR